jgi:hypothetical protein
MAIQASRAMRIACGVGQNPAYRLPARLTAFFPHSYAQEYGIGFPRVVCFRGKNEVRYFIEQIMNINWNPAHHDPCDPAIGQHIPVTAMHFPHYGP